MKFLPVWSYDNYVAAHIAMGRLEEEGYRCWLKDENTVTIDPILTNAVGGIKLMVAEPQAKNAYLLLKQLHDDHQSIQQCPACGGNQVSEVSTPNKATNWLSAIIGFLFTSYALPIQKANHCFTCGHEYAVEN